MHMRTLEALPEVETVHVCHLGGGDRDTIRQASSKIASENDRLEDLLERDVDALLVLYGMTNALRRSMRRWTPESPRSSRSREP